MWSAGALMGRVYKQAAKWQVQWILSIFKESFMLKVLILGLHSKNLLSRFWKYFNIQLALELVIQPNENRWAK